MAKEMNLQKNSDLTRLPIEILTRITRNLSTNDLGNVRLACKRLERSLFNSFSHEFFRKKQFMAYSTSLQALIDISHHPHLSQTLSHVLISADTISSTLDHPNADLSPQRFEHFKKAFLDNEHLWRYGGLLRKLTEAFRNLPNLEIVDIRDFNSRSRSRDGANAEWRSYGARTLERQTGLKVSPYPSSGTIHTILQFRNAPSELFTVVLAALASADARPRSIEVNTRIHWGIADSAFSFPDELRPSVVPVLQGLRTLHLTIQATGGYFPGFTVAPSHNHEPCIVSFLSSTPNLTWLRLNFMSQPSDDRVLSRLAQPVDGTSSTVHLDHLERFDIGGTTVKIRPPLLLAIINKFKTLQTLSLRRVSFVMNELEAETQISPFVTFFKKLQANTDLDIREFNLQLLSFGVVGPGFPQTLAQVLFNDNGIVGQERCFTGNSGTECINKVLAALPSEWPEYLRNASNSDHGEDDEEDEEDDDDGDGDGDDGAGGGDDDGDAMDEDE